MSRTFKSNWLLAVLSLLMLALSFTASAQRADGNIGGNAEPGDSITVDNTQTGLHREMSADDRGRYRFNSLPLGQYVVVISRNGTPILKTTVKLNPGGTARPPTPPASTAKPAESADN